MNQVWEVLKLCCFIFLYSSFFKTVSLAVRSSFLMVEEPTGAVERCRVRTITHCVISSHFPKMLSLVSSLPASCSRYPIDLSSGQEQWSPDLICKNSRCSVAWSSVPSPPVSPPCPGECAPGALSPGAITGMLPSSFIHSSLIQQICISHAPWPSTWFHDRFF